MDEWPDEKIRSTSIRYINAHAMNFSAWRVTVIGEMRSELLRFVEMNAGEFPIVSCFHSKSSWYVLSTRRVLGAYEDQMVDVPVLDVVKQDFGNFKGYGRTTAEVMNLELADRRTTVLEYETGDA